MKSNEKPSHKLHFDARGVPISDRFDDPYFSFGDGLAETQYVFLSGNDLPARLCEGFEIAEIGFGTGLNFLASWQAWRNKAPKGRIQFTSFELDPMAREDQARALAAFPELAPLATQFLDEFDGQHFEADEIALRVIHGDANETLSNWQGRADAWFLDGFSPAKNPEAWSEALMQEVANHTKAGGSFTTYSAAGHVRLKLANAGFAVERIKGFGHKRHMLRGRLAAD